MDVKKLGNIPDGGGWRVVGQARGYQNKKATTTARYRHGRPAIGYSYLHTATDDTPAWSAGGSGNRLTRHRRRGTSAQSAAARW